jgi:putative membrane protein
MSGLNIESERCIMPMMWGYDYSWGNWLLMLLNMVFWVAVFGLLVWALLRWLSTRPSSTGPTGPSALGILQQRFARGEIDAATYEQMRERLAGGTPPHEPAGVS